MKRIHNSQFPVALEMHSNVDFLNSSISSILLYKVHYITTKQRSDKLIAFYGTGAMNEVFFYDPKETSRKLNVEHNRVSCQLKRSWLEPGKHLFYLRIIYEDQTEHLTEECVVETI